MADLHGTPGLSKRSGMISLDLPEGAVPMHPGGVDDHHVTLAYLGPDVDDKQLMHAVVATRRAAGEHGPLLLGVGGLGTFPPSESSDGKTPAYVPVVKTQGLAALRGSVGHLDASGRPDWTPHITLAYLDDPKDAPAPVSGREIPIRTVTVHRGDDSWSFPLRGSGAPGPAATKVTIGGRVSGMELGKVGPKGYIHGWIFVGAPGVGDEVYHPQHGRGKITAHDGKSVTVAFHGGTTHRFTAKPREGAEHHFEPRSGNAVSHGHLADRVVRDQKEIKGLKDDELKGVDKELTDRAAALGHAGRVTKTHQKVKDEIARRSDKADANRQERADIFARERKQKAYEKELGTAGNASRHADRTGVATDHQNAAFAHRRARDAAMTDQQREHHQAQSDHHEAEATRIKDAGMDAREAEQARRHRIGNQLRAKEPPAESGSHHEALQQIARAELAVDENPSAANLRAAADAHRLGAERSAHPDHVTLRMMHERKAKDFDQRANEAAQSEKPKADYDALRSAADRYNAASPAKEGSSVGVYDNPERMNEAIRLHTAARRAAPDAKSKKRHTDEIKRHQQYLSQIEHNRKNAEFQRDSEATQKRIKELGGRYNYELTTVKGQDELADLHAHMADLHEQRAKDLDSAGFGGSNEHVKAAEQHRDQSAIARENANGLREKHEAFRQHVASRMANAEILVGQREDLARQTGTKKDIEHAIAGHEEIARNATAADMHDVADRHTAAAAKLREDYPDGGKKPSRSAKKPATSVPEDEKIDSAWGKLHPADLMLDHYGNGLNDSKHYNDAIKELDRRGATPDGRGRVSRARRQAAKDLESHEKFRAEYDKPGGRGEMHRVQGEASRLSTEADEKNTSAAHAAAAEAHQRARTLSYRHEPGAVQTQNYHKASIDYHEAKARQLRATEPPSPEKVAAYDEASRAAFAATSEAERVDAHPSHDDVVESAHQEARLAHEKAARLATTDQQRTAHTRIAADHKAAENAAATRRDAEYEKQEAQRQAAAKYKDAATRADAASEKARREPTALNHAQAAEAHREAGAVATNIGQLQEHIKAATDHDAKAAANTHVAPGNRDDDKAAAELSHKKAQRTGSLEDHIAANHAYVKIANDEGVNRYDRVSAGSRAADHARAAESINYADDSENDAKIHADAAERTKDSDAHRAAAEAYREAAEALDDVPGTTKRRKALTASADQHEADAAEVDRKTAAYADAFTAANRASNQANRTGNAVDHRRAVVMHREAAAASITPAQQTYHVGEAASQQAKSTT